jgi:ABC-2 type transport system permease protein
MKRWLLKYAEVARITVRSRWAYLWDQLLSNWFLIIVMFVFVQLWKVTYAATGSSSLAGFTLPEMVWYLVATESIVMSLPRVSSTIDQEVKDGDLAIRLNKPYSYLLFHFSAFLGEAFMRLTTLLLVSSVTAYLLVGGFDFRWEAIPALLFVFLVTASLHFCYVASIGLAAFWMEDTAGLYFVFDRVKWLLGGMMLPVELFPGVVRTIAEALPFRYMIAGPARLFVKFSWAEAGQLLLAQAFWLTVFGLLCAGLYRLGVRKVDVNGG